MKSYQQYCGVAKALDIIGERWTILIFRDLLLGPRRYTELLNGLPGITTNLLAKRLRHLEHHELVCRVAAPAGGHVYELTPRGRETEAVVLAIGQFGSDYLRAMPTTEHRSPRWLMVSMKRMYRGTKAVWRIGICLDDTWFSLRTGQTLHVVDGEPAEADLWVTASLTGLAKHMRGLAAEPLDLRGPEEVFDDLMAAIRP